MPRGFEYVEHCYKRSLLRQIDTAGGADWEKIGKLFAANDLDPRAVKRIIRKAELDASGAGRPLSISDIYLAGCLFGIELVGRVPRDSVIDL